MPHQEADRVIKKLFMIVLQQKDNHVCPEDAITIINYLDGLESRIDELENKVEQIMPTVS